MSTIIKLDHEQERAVTQLNNAVVSAGAGSGKTRVLANRFAWLIHEKHYKIHEILTLTFTKKATNEMYSRIYQTLRAINETYVADFSSAAIKTLDSYCAQIVRSGAHFYGIRPDFTQDDEAAEDITRKAALPFILKYKNNPALQTIIKTNDVGVIAEELFSKPVLTCSTLMDPIDYPSLLTQQKLIVVENWRKLTSETVSLAHDVFSTFDDTNENKNTKFGIFLADQNIREIPELPQLTLSEIETCNTTMLEPYLSWLKKICFGVLLPTGMAAEKWRGTTTCIKELRLKYEKITALANFAGGYTIVAAITPLMNEFQQLIADAKRKEGILTFSDCASLAVKILSEHPEIRAVEKKKYRAIMIDEFQDNNADQRDLLFMLAEKIERTACGVPEANDLCPDKLFFVGDEKQSIYRFRGADVSVFRSLDTAFPTGTIELNTNYRSEPALIAAFNTIFGGYQYPPTENSREEHGTHIPSIFSTSGASAENDIPLYEARYRPIYIPPEKVNGKAYSVLYTPRIHIALLNTGKVSDDDTVLNLAEEEAFWTAQKIKELIGGTENSAIRPGDIAILIRKYAIQPLYERALQQIGIPYNSEVIKGFFSDGPVNDIFSFLRLIVYPDDRFAYAEVLHSPFCGLSLDTVETILASDTVPFTNDTVAILTTSGSTVAAERYISFCTIFTETIAYSRTATLTQLVTQLWYRLGYRYETMWNKKVAMYRELYDQIFELARRAEEQNLRLADFVDSMHSLSQQNKQLNDMDIPLEHGDAVHLLTIFRSKGLEYPVVFVCGTADQTTSDRNGPVIYCSKTFGISLNTPPISILADDKNAKKNFFYEIMKEEENRMARAELKRILYVAMTRAVSQLYITGRYNGEFATGKESATLYQLIEPLLLYYTQEDHKHETPFTFEEIVPVSKKEQSFHPENNQNQNTFAAKEIFLSRIVPLYKTSSVKTAPILISKYKTPTESHTCREPVHQDVLTKKDEIPYHEINDIIDNTSQRFNYDTFGTIAHTFLEAKLKGNEAHVATRDIAALGNDSEKITTIERICREMTDQFVQSDIGKAALSSSWKRTEYKFRLFYDSSIIKGTIDLVFLNDNDTYTIIDYKTDQYIEPERYYEQLSWYREAIAAITGSSISKITCVLYYLRFGKTIDVTSLCSGITANDGIE
jgi:ATP-dependent exoDNAse (exonuclease V) beta subunit